MEALVSHQGLTCSDSSLVELTGWMQIPAHSLKSAKTTSSRPFRAFMILRRSLRCRMPLSPNPAMSFSRYQKWPYLTKTTKPCPWVNRWNNCLTLLDRLCSQVSGCTKLTRRTALSLPSIIDSGSRTPNRSLRLAHLGATQGRKNHSLTLHSTSTIRLSRSTRTRMDRYLLLTSLTTRSQLSRMVSRAGLFIYHSQTNSIRS